MLAWSKTACIHYLDTNTYSNTRWQQDPVINLMANPLQMNWEMWVLMFSLCKFDLTGTWPNPLKTSHTHANMHTQLWINFPQLFPLFLLSLPFTLCENYKSLHTGLHTCILIQTKGTLSQARLVPWGQNRFCLMELVIHPLGVLLILKSVKSGQEAGWEDVRILKDKSQKKKQTHHKGTGHMGETEKVGRVWQIGANNNINPTPGLSLRGETVYVQTRPSRCLE